MTRDRDHLWMLLCVGALAIGALLQAAAIRRLQDDMAFTKLAASAAFITEET